MVVSRMLDIVSRDDCYDDWVQFMADQGFDTTRKNRHGQTLAEACHGALAVSTWEHYEELAKDLMESAQDWVME